MFAYVRIKSLMFAYFEKKCFFGVVLARWQHTTGGGCVGNGVGGILEYWGTEAGRNGLRITRRVQRGR